MLVITNSYYHDYYKNVHLFIQPSFKLFHRNINYITIPQSIR